VLESVAYALEVCMKEIGKLRKHTFFFIQEGLAIVVKKGTTVYAHSSTPTIVFEGTPIYLAKMGGVWFIDVFGDKHTIIFDPQRPPYPISYFRKQ